MRGRLAVLAVATAALATPGSAQDAAIVVNETITARFDGSWNGIYRMIPVKYRTSQGLNWTLGVQVLSATDQDGQALRVETSRERHYLKVKMWVPGAVNATRTITLRYRATNGLRFFEEHDELYWNVTGDEWDIPVGTATARIELPPGAKGLRAIAYTGVYGSTAQEAGVETAGGTIRIATRRPLGYREGLTAVVGWDKGLVQEPSTSAKAVGVLASNWPLVIPIPVFFLVFAIWRRRGKDPDQLPITVRYEPPPGLTPGEAGTLIDNSVDLRDITATLVDLGVRGYLQFEEVDNRKLFGLIGSRDYTLRRLELPAGTAPLADHEQRVFDGVFGGRGSTVMLSQLEDEFYTSISGIKDGIFRQLLRRGFYDHRPDTLRAGWMVGGVILGVVIAGGGGAVAHRLLMTPVPFIIAGVLVAAILLIFGAFMPARTAAAP
jgi:hypothetical protein